MSIRTCGFKSRHHRFQTWPVRLAAGCETLNLAAWVRSPYGSLNIAKWRNRDTRDAQNVVPARACEFDSRLGYWILQVGRRPTSFGHRPQVGRGRCARFDTGTCNLLRVGQCSFGPGTDRRLVSLNGRVRPPDPLLMAEYANRQSGHVESVAILWVRIPPEPLHAQRWRSVNGSARQIVDLLARVRIPSPSLVRLE